MTSRYIYKICPSTIWHDAEAAGHFEGAGIDLVDGYIHFSTAAQVAETAHLHFTAQEGLSLIEIDSHKLDITWEASRGGQLFPHLYERLPLSAVVQTWSLAVGDDGRHILPAFTQE